MGDVKRFNSKTKLDVPVERVMDGAKEANLENAVVIGWRGADLYFATSCADAGEILLLLEAAKIELMQHI